MTQTNVSFAIENRSLVAEAIATTLAVNINDNLDVTPFTSMGEAIEAIKATIKTNFAKPFDYARKAGTELTSRITMQSLSSLEMTRIALAPLAMDTERKVINAVANGELPNNNSLLQLTEYAARVMVVRYIAENVDAILDMAVKYDENLEDSFDTDPKRFWLYLSDAIHYSAGHITHN
jgi:hypothetical protein